MTKNHADALEEIEKRLADQDAEWERITHHIAALGDCQIQIPEAALRFLEEECTSHVCRTTTNFNGLRA